MDKKSIKKYYKFLFVLVIAVVGFVAGNVTTHAAVNNTMGNAQYISTNGTNYSSNVTSNIKSRYYKFTLNESGKITLNYKAYKVDNSSYGPDYYIYDSNGEALVEETWNEFDYVTQMYTTIEQYDLTKGTYYFCVTENKANFNFSIKFNSANETFSEVNGGSDNLMSKARNISLKKNYKGQIALNDDRDFYKFSVNTNCKLKIDIRAYMQYSDYYLYDSNGFEIMRETWREWNSNSKLYSDTMFVDIKKGTYYFCVTECYGRTGNYNFTLSMSATSIKLNKKEIWLDKNKTYTLKPTLKPATNEKIKWTSDDSAVATVDSKGVVRGKRVGRTIIRAVVGDNVSAECVVYVKPSASKITKLKAGRKSGKYRYVNVKYKGVKDASGYKIYYATSSKGKYKLLYTTSSTSVDFYLKRKKTYYFKIRAYKYTWDKDVYSNYSGVKSIKL